MLTQEYGTASNIKSRVNRLSVLAAITSTQQRLKLYNRIPPNGLVLFVGTILTDEGKEKKVTFDFEPHKPINAYVSVVLFLSSYVPTDDSDRFIYVTTNFTLNRFLNFLKPILVSASSLWMVTEPSSVLFQETHEK
jgi:peptide chain release factor subunit 1